MADEKEKPNLAALYTPGQLDVLNELVRVQTQLGLADEKFAQKHLTVSASTWFRLKSGTYQADATASFTKLEGNLRVYREEQAQAGKLTGRRVYHELTPHKQVFNAVTTAKLKDPQDANRLVVFLAPTGGGKTTLARQLKIQHDGVLVEARESWRKSYYGALCDIALAAGVAESEMGGGERAMEQALLKRLRTNRRVLIIDEGEYFGPRTINLLKLILNQTETVIVLMAIPSLYEWWQKKSWEQAKQLNRRGCAIVGADLVHPTDVDLFLSGAGFTVRESERTDIRAQIAKAANEFGRYDLVDRVICELREEDTRDVRLDQVTTAIRQVKALLNRKAA